tara:strand:- start:36617 stop:37216 length:600 start_codon:yes stop_codon:yes gene_type:complete
MLPVKQSVRAQPARLPLVARWPETLLETLPLVTLPLVTLPEEPNPLAPAARRAQPMVVEPLQAAAPLLAEPTAAASSVVVAQPREAAEPLVARPLAALLQAVEPGPAVVPGPAVARSIAMAALVERSTAERAQVVVPSLPLVQPVEAEPMLAALEPTEVAPKEAEPKLAALEPAEAEPLEELADWLRVAPPAPVPQLPE